MQVIKRDGRIVDFDKEKVKNVVLKAFVSVDGEETQYAKDKARDIANFVASINREYIDVEEIQDIVRDKLMASNRKDVASAFVICRNDRERIRIYKSSLMQDVASSINIKNKSNQNANVDEESHGGRMGAVGDVITKDYALNKCVSRRTRMNHIKNIVYIHDLSNYAVGNHNCLTIPVDHLLKYGFSTRQTDVRGANSVSTAFQLIVVQCQLQSLEQFGGVACSHLDWTMIPYVRKSFYKAYNRVTDIKMFAKSLDLTKEQIEETSINDKVYKGKWYNFIKRFCHKKAIKLLKEEISQAVEGMYHNLNTLQSRSGNQLPFTSINYGTCTLEEGRMITKALLEGSIKGTGRFHKTSIFPCGIFKLKKGVNRKKGDPNYDLFKLALKSTAQRLYPNYANVDWSGNLGYDENDPKTEFATMGCRTANGFDMNGFGQLKDGRGNICPSTIILPTVAMMAKEKFEETKDGDLVEIFMELLDQIIHETRDSLIDRYKYICSQSPNSAKFMYENNTMVGYVPKEGIRSALKHGTLAIGQLGLAETLQILIGCDHTEEKGMELAKRIEQLFSDRCSEFKHELRTDDDGYEYYLNFGVYYTPAENLCYTAMQKFKAKYGEIPNVSDKEFFTNSMHIPVWKEMSPFRKIDLESQLTGYSSAGCITYVELDSSVKNNLEALESIVNYAMDKDIPYFAINVPNDQCMNCGYIDDIGDECPQCHGIDIKRLRRVTGYLTSDYKTSFNKGKQQEVEMRVKHK